MLRQQSRLGGLARRASRTIGAVALTGVLTAGASLAVTAVGAGEAQAAAPTRAKIVEIARGEIGNNERDGSCEKYGPCRTTPWCAMFVRWVWKQAGVSPVPTTNVARAVGLWGKEHNLFHRGNPKPGDIIVYGTPAEKSGGHVELVETVLANGDITAIGGNRGDAVKQIPAFDPDEATAGTDKLHISGYVTPPGISDTDPEPDRDPSIHTYNGDQVADIMALATEANGKHLYTYGGRGDGTFNGRVHVGNGWGIYNFVDSPGDINGDGRADLVARKQEADGQHLYVYLGAGNNGFYSAKHVGYGWGAYNLIAGVGDINSDGRADLVARAAEADGNHLYMYPGRKDGTFGSRVHIGNGWGVYNEIEGAGDIDGDGDSDLVARVQEDDGQHLYVYLGNGNGTFAGRIHAGNGWGTYNVIAGIGDTNKDGHADLVARAAEPDGSHLYLYRGTKAGGFTSRVEISNGWGVYDDIF